MMIQQLRPQLFQALARRRAIQSWPGLLARRQGWVLAALLLLLALAGRATWAAQDIPGPLYTAEVQGTMTSVTIGYLRGALRQAETADATALIITLSSDGGVLRDIRPFAGEIARARVPVVVYVAPQGTQAGAPGALFLSAAHISAMAPGTSFGSPYPLAQVDAALTQQTRDLLLDSVADQLHDWNAAQGRNTDWLPRAVAEGAVLTNEQAIALDPPAVDLVAADQQQLLTLLEGRSVRLADGRSIKLTILGRPLTPIQPTLWQSIRLALAEPTLVFALLILGVMAIYLEFAAPGSTLFIGVGLVLLVGAFMGLIVLPIQPWSLGLLLAGLVLVGVEFFVLTHGGFAIAGLALIVVGALNLIDPAQAPGVSVAGWVVFVVAAAVAGLAGLGLWLAVGSRARPVTTGQEALIGKLAEVRQRLDPEGMVFVDGALWKAISENGVVERGDWVRIAAIHNLQLVVQRVELEEPSTH